MTGLPSVAHDHHDDGYDGPALLVTATDAVPVHAALRGFFQPVSGRYHWQGRVSAPEGALEPLARRKQDAVLVTPEGEALCTVSDPDLWRRLSVKGTSAPPFTVVVEAPAV